MNKKTYPVLATRHSDNEVINVTLTEEIAFKDGWNQAINKVLQIIKGEKDEQ